MADDTALFSNNSQYRLRLTISVSGSTVSYNLRVEKLSGSGFSGGDSYSYGLSVGGTSLNGSWGPYSFVGKDSITLRSGTVSKGSGSYTASAWANAASSLGRAPSSGTVSVGFTIADQPGKPSKPSISDVTTTTYETTVAAPASNGSSIVEYQVEAAHSTSGGTVYGNGNSRTRKITGRNPGDGQYSRWRARNGMGWGPWSDWTGFWTFPVAPGSLTLKNATVSSIDVSWDRGGNGDNPAEYQVQHNSSASESGATAFSAGTNTSRTISGLPAGSTRFVRVRARTSAGWGAWTSWASLATLPSAPPGLTVSPTDGGKSANVNLSPPSGVTTVTKYRVEYRRAPNGTVTSTDQTAGFKITGRTPGASYQYRASAFIGNYQTPWSDWITVLQPNTSWLPGDYLAGSLAAGADVTYAWTGTANASTSTATGKSVTGIVCGGGGTIHRVTGGRSGSYSARMLVLTDTAQIQFGQGTGAAERAAVSPGGVYVGSIFMNPSAAKMMRAELQFLNASNAVVQTVATDYRAVPAGEDTRLVVTGTAPADAVWVVVRARNDTSTPMLGGDYVDIDALMISVGALYDYFDGSTPDTAQYDYAWTGAANASPSQRFTLPAGVVDPLADPDCPPLPLPPSPPSIEAECVDPVGTWRRYWSVIPADEISDHLSAVPTFTLETSADVGQVRIRMYPNPDDLSPESVDTSTWASEQLVTFIPANTVLVIDGVTESAQASVAGGSWLSADHLLQGTNGGPATWPELSCGQAYVVSYDVPLDQPDGNLIPSIQLTERF